MYDFQKASMWKRISAALFDFILLSIVVTGVACLISLAIGYSAKADELGNLNKAYEEQYGVTALGESLTKLEEGYKEKYKLTEFDADKLSEEEKKQYDEVKAQFKKAEDAMYADEEYEKKYSNLAVAIFNYTLIIISFSILSGYLIVEFLFPMIFKNGQTLGKKIFGVAVMRIDGVKVSPLLMFIRTILGKYTVETMIIVFSILIIMFAPGAILVGLIVIAAVLIMQLVLLIVTKARTPIHDKLASTVTVDFATQMIFDTKEEMMAYQKRIHEEQAETSTEGQENKS